MIAKGMHIALLFIVILVALNSVGIDLTALAFFSGAVGFGVGFGLQKVVANFISGVILLSDKSIKPGDVIEHGGVYGWVNRMGGRCVSVITRDEKEFLIPNESLIVNPVVNWSYSSKNIRVKADIGISYNADPHRAIELITGCLEGDAPGFEISRAQMPGDGIRRQLGESAIALLDQGSPERGGEYYQRGPAQGLGHPEGQSDRDSLSPA